MKKTENLHIRIDKQMYEELKKKAERENRTISCYVITQIKKDLGEKQHAGFEQG